jgi:glycosyltransferase involved in cell wall biosynthesis
MKLISFVIPSYNSEKYLHTAVNSLLIAGDEVEIIIVNDGSKDRTLEIANQYKVMYPNIVQVIDKPNGGHGSGVNAGLKVATGIYYKVVDSDDWLDQDSLQKLMKQIRIHLDQNQSPDLYITNFVYEHVEDKTAFERDYSENFPVDQLFDWNHTLKKFKYSKTLLMHALIYKTKVLRDSGLNLPEHTFYVDNIVAYLPLPFVKHIYYMKLPLYRYFIGRADQSVTLKNITKRYEQQIRVYKAVSSAYSLNQINQLPKGLKYYMKHFLSAIMIITQMFTVGEHTKERQQHLIGLWKDLKKQDIKMYRFLRYRSYNTWVNILPWRLKSFVMVKGYLYLAKKVKLG